MRQFLFHLYISKKNITEQKTVIGSCRNKNCHNESRNQSAGISNVLILCTTESFSFKSLH